MKTQVIQLEEADNLTTARDKMSWAKAERILLIFSKTNSNFTRQLDLLLLKRYSVTLGAQLGIVSHSIAVRSICARLEIPVFHTPAGARRGKWMDKPALKNLQAEKPPHADLRSLKQTLPGMDTSIQVTPSARISLFSLGILAVLVVLLLFLPSATIDYQPQTKIQNLSLAVHADPNASKVNLAGDIPAHSLALEFHSIKTLPVLNELLIPDAFATGSVRFTNMTESQVSIPANTVIRSIETPSIRFATIEDAVLAPGLEKTVDVQVRAVAPGVNGNLSAGSLTSVEGDLGFSISVINLQAMSGGSEKIALFPSDDERSLLRETMMLSLQDECRSALLESLTDEGKKFLLPAIEIDLVDETSYPAEGKPGGMLALVADIRCSGLTIDLVDLNVLAAASLDASLTENFVPFSGDIEISRPEDYEMQEDGSVNFHILVSRPIYADLDIASSQFQLIGKNIHAASAYLSTTFLLDGAPVIHTTPSWWRRMPFVPFRIIVQQVFE